MTCINIPFGKIYKIDNVKDKSVPSAHFRTVMFLNDLRFRLIYVAFLFQALSATSVSAQGEYAVAGLAPQSRPAGAPVITSFDKSPDWRARALSGVSGPHPPGLDFLNSQGAWYTPFTHPGMPEPYDLRGWHAHGKPGAGEREVRDK